MKLLLKNNIYPFVEEILDSYAILFFSNSKLLGGLLLLVTFFKPFAGLTGLIAVVIAISFASYTGISKTVKEKGLFSFNGLLMGIGMGTFYNPGTAFWLLFFILVILTVIFSGVLWNLLSKWGLPFLVIPFIACFWLVIMVSREFEAIDLTTRNIYWINEMFNLGGKALVDFMMFFENLPLPFICIAFFKSLSSLFFQDNVLSGLIIFSGLLIHSRIASTLLVLGYITASIFNGVVHTYSNDMNSYLMAANFIMVAVAIGSFFTIPSVHSYLWAVLSVPFTFIIAIALSKVTSLFQVPVYTLPFCFVTIVMVFFFSIKIPKGRITLTPIQNYSPEKNLYSFLNNQERKVNKNYFQFQLPFIGQWIVSQGYEGNITHKGEWSYALDFVIVDGEMKTYTKYALECENFYCFNKPVLAPGDGFVVEVIDGIEDNEIGKINQLQNWGNTIIIKHAEGLFTKMCHLRKGSFKVKPGDYVQHGDVIAACGNSGRSPEPHLHFQVQTTPYVGSKTLAYPFVSFRRNGSKEKAMAEFEVPEETEVVSNIVINESLAKAFEFLPGYRMKLSADGFENTVWEVFTDAFNYNYLYCYNTKSIAYFRKSNAAFYFISFFGERNSLLYYFYESCYKVSLTTESGLITKDKFPLQLSSENPGKWLQDLVSPFYIFRDLMFESENSGASNDNFSNKIMIKSRQHIKYFNFEKLKSSSEIEIEDNKIKSFCIKMKNTTTKAICS